MDPAHLEILCKEFDIGAPSEVQDNHEGALNWNYLLKTDKGKYFIKSLRDKRKADVPFIAGVEALMHSRGIPAVCMMSTISGSNYLQVDSFVYTVYPFIESDRSHRYDLADFKVMGRMLGLLHHAGSSDIPDLLQSKVLKTSIDEPADNLKAYKTLIGSKETIDDTDRLFLHYIDLKLSLLETVEKPDTLASNILIHGDYHTRNLLMSDTREIIGICDWENARMGPRAYELARSIQYICFSGDYDNHPETYDESQAIDAAYSLIEGYQESYPISSEEMRAGFAMRQKKLVTSIWIEENHYGLNDSRSTVFVPHEMRLIREFDQEGMLEKLILSI